MDESIVSINSGESFLGTGFVIDTSSSSSYVLTCGHVIDKVSANNIYIDGFSAQILKNEYHNGVDLALLQIETLKPSLKVSEACDESNSASVYGYSRLSEKVKFEPIKDIELKCDVSFTDPANDSKFKALKLMPSEPIGKGYSGSPVICQASHQVIGIVLNQTLSKDNYAICSKEILSFYSPTKDNQKINLCQESFPKKSIDYLDEKQKLEVEYFLRDELDKSLVIYSNQPALWLTPSLYKEPEDKNSFSASKHKISISELISSPRNINISSRPQYGLTSLAKKLVYSAWCDESSNSFWLYIDARSVRPYPKEIERYSTDIINKLNLKEEDVECVIVDQISNDLDNKEKLLPAIKTVFPEAPIITMFTDQTGILGSNSNIFGELYQPDNLYLWSLKREDIRQLVRTYNLEQKYIEDDNTVINKVVSDLDVLNIPRTPLNCLTLLKVSESYFDDSPVNRTDLIRRVLSLLFNVDQIPRYKSKPDLKDTEFVLGYFCEHLIKDKKNFFTRNEFINSLHEFCSINEIDLEVDVIFDVLHSNNIIVSTNNKNFAFKFTYWIFYFAAYRMTHNSDFYDYVFSNMNYSNYPEILEFYTGIDRQRNNAIEVLIKDLKCLREMVIDKTGISDQLTIFDNARWSPSEEQLTELKGIVSEDVEKSKLPETVKDKFADHDYDPAKSHNQSINEIIEEFSLYRFMQGISACSVALRNSDFVDKKLKHELLEEIMLSLVFVAKIILILSPILSERGRASLQGANFIVAGDFGNNVQQRVNNIITAIPYNVVKWYRDKLFSVKMGPMLFNFFKENESELIKHMLTLLIVNKRPRKWESHIESVIIKEHKNSFFLFDLFENLLSEYRYSYLDKQNLESVKLLLEKTVAKHQLGVKKPSDNYIKKASKKGSFNLPDREVVDD